MPKNLVVINGSPRVKSTSGVLAGRISARLAKSGWESIAHCLRAPHDYDQIAKDVIAADLVVVSSPVYVGALPGIVIRFLETFSCEFNTPPALLAITNCGFYEPYENDNALAVLKRFADATGFRWIGGFGIGCGGMIAGGHSAENVFKGLDAAADAIAIGEDPPARAFELVRKPPVPKWAYFLMANLSMAVEVRRHGDLLGAGARPYAQNDGKTRKALMLVSGSEGDRILQSAVDIAGDKLKAHGWDAERMNIDEMNIRPCVGCFGCWLRQPGECLSTDDNRRVTAAVIASDLVIIASPLSFGSYASRMKIALDHLIPLISPFFTLVHGDMRHRKRYPRYPLMLAIGRQSQKDAEEEALFRRIVKHNASNLSSTDGAAIVLNPATAPAEMDSAVSCEINNMVEATR